MIAMPAEERRAYLKRLYPYLKTSLVIFGSGIVIGLMAVSHFPLLAQHFESSVVDFVKLFHGLSKLELAAAIFLNNTLKTVLAILLGSLFGIIPAGFFFLKRIGLGGIFLLLTPKPARWVSFFSILPPGMIG